MDEVKHRESFRLPFIVYRPWPAAPILAPTCLTCSPYNYDLQPLCSPYLQVTLALVARAPSAPAAPLLALWGFPAGSLGPKAARTAREFFTYFTYTLSHTRTTQQKNCTPRTTVSG